MLGLLFFILAILFSLINNYSGHRKVKTIPNRNTHKKFRFSNTFLLAFIIIVGSFLSLVLADIFTSPPQNNKAQTLPIITIAPEPTIIPITIPTIGSIKESQRAPSNQITCIGPDNKEFKTTKEECERLNKSWGKSTDYIVNCQINQACGGGTKEMRLSDCNNTTCCEIGNKWYFYLSKDKCRNDQTAYNNNGLITCNVFGKSYRVTSQKCSEYLQYEYQVEQNKLSFQRAMDAIVNDFKNDANQILQEAKNYPTATPIPNLYGNWEPTQFTAPSQKCYSTWDEYFNAHPNYAPQNIIGTSPNPPCD